MIQEFVLECLCFVWYYSVFSFAVFNESAYLGKNKSLKATRETENQGKG